MVVFHPLEATYPPTVPAGMLHAKVARWATRSSEELNEEANIKRQITVIREEVRELEAERQARKK